MSNVRQHAEQLTQPGAVSSRDKGRWTYRLRPETERNAAAPVNSLAPDADSLRWFVWDELILRFLEANGDDPGRWFTAFELVHFDSAGCAQKFGDEKLALRNLSSILSDMCLKKQILERVRRLRQEVAEAA